MSSVKNEHNKCSIIFTFGKSESYKFSVEFNHRVFQLRRKHASPNLIPKPEIQYNSLSSLKGSLVLAYSAL
jgi:hypothetical protein